jgi:hypothetical protein
MKRALWYLAPPLLCLAVFWRVPFVWFRIDDFAWLGLSLQVVDIPSLGRALFQPLAQGTVRVLSERIPFLVFGALFGLHSWPFRILAFGTWFLALFLMQAIGTRLTGSRAAGLLAALLWTSSAEMAVPLAWASAYNQILCALTALAAFYSRLRWIESDEPKWRWREGVAFLAGFSVLETIVVYPGVVSLHALTNRAAWEKWRSSLWMWAPAALFTLAHLFWIPKDPSPIYARIIDERLPGNLLRYTGWTVGPSDLSAIPPGWGALAMMTTWAIGLSLAAFVVLRSVRGDRTALFCCGWFLFFLAPVLALPNHVSTYYLALPGIGLAWVGGWAVASGVKSGGPARAAAVVLAGAYWAGSVVEAHKIQDWHLRVTSRLRILMRGVERSAAAHPGSALVLQGVDEELFLSSFLDDPFRLVGIRRVHVAAANATELSHLPEFRNAQRFHITREDTMQLLQANQARVLSVAGDAVRDVTRAYRMVLEAELRAIHRNVVDPGNPAHAARLGPGWYAAENGARWIGKRASFTIAGPRTASEKLFLAGFSPPAALERGPLTVNVGVDGVGSSSAQVMNTGPFALAFPLPRKVVGAYAIEVVVECSRTFRPGNDARDLGVVLNKIEVR